MPSPTFLPIVTSIATVIALAQEDEGPSSDDQPEGRRLGCSEIISLVGVLIAFLTAVAGFIGWRYKRYSERKNQLANTETEMGFAHPEYLYPQIPRDPNGHLVAMWIEVPPRVAVPDIAVTSPGRVIEAKGLEESCQERAGVESQGVILPRRAARAP